MKKIAMFVFNGDPLCFIHVLLNALDMEKKGYEIKIVMEGSAVKLIPELAQEKNPLYHLWEKVKKLNLVDGVCKACSNKMGTLEAAEKQGLNLLDDMNGHPGMARYDEEGFEVMIF